ncbi:MAG: hypothetical protein ABIJ46_02535 [bacterium]
MSSIAISPAALVAAIKAADMILGNGAEWDPVNVVQQEWLESYYRPLAELVGEVPGIAAHATTVPRAHVDFLAQHGWEAQISTVPPNGFLTAAILDVLVRWLEIGERTRIHVRGIGSFDAFLLKEGVKIYRLSQDGGDFFGCGASTSECVFEMKTQSGDRILIAELPEDVPVPTDSFSLMGLVDSRLRQRAVGSGDSCDSLELPMVHLQTKAELPQLVGLSSGNHFIGQVCQQAELKMNQEGARARAAVEVCVLECCSSAGCVITHPFLISIERSVGQKSIPVFCAYVDYGSWKNPGDL